MNQKRKEKNYKYYCTEDPATWETNDPGEPEMLVMDTQKTQSSILGYAEGRGRLGGGKQGEGGGMQQIPDKGWEGRRADMGTGSNKVNSNIQTEAPKYSNMYGINLRNNDKQSEMTRQTGGRNYKQGTPKGKEIGAPQMTLNTFWKGKEKDM